MVSVREVLGLNLFIGRKIKMTFFHNQALKHILELNLFVGCEGVEDSRNIVGLKLWADENGYGKMYYIVYCCER